MPLPETWKIVWLEHCTGPHHPIDKLYALAYITLYTTTEQQSNKYCTISEAVQVYQLNAAAAQTSSTN